jgi:hypothetical protein
MGSDGVVDLAEPIDFDGQGVAVADRATEQMLVLQGAEEPLDHPVGLRALDAGADVAQQRVIAGERPGEHRAAEARPVVADDRDRRRHGAQQIAGGLIDQINLAAVVAQVVEVG